MEFGDVNDLNVVAYAGSKALELAERRVKIEEKEYYFIKHQHHQYQHIYLMHIFFQVIVQCICFIFSLKPDNYVSVKLCANTVRFGGREESEDPIAGGKLDFYY